MKHASCAASLPFATSLLSVYVQSQHRCSCIAGTKMARLHSLGNRMQRSCLGPQGSLERPQQRLVSRTPAVMLVSPTASAKEQRWTAACSVRRGTGIFFAALCAAFAASLCCNAGRLFAFSTCKFPSLMAK
ncbi:hypothetical protein BD289DRAFT_420591 [Coniella lustricola]|uniref:Uncharacterized protein n=1 Tax=Coniella lustricola TaxID=2025994 RepID=A0A2T3AMD5_9PEZI|nr:hypothetical protein BD289DRAFT_420591 [Coniella lustricola]